MRDATFVKVSFFHRKPADVGTYSIEFIYDDVRKRLSDKLEAKVHVSKYLSSGLFKRAFNVAEAAWRARGEIAHMTGDTHYIVLLMNKRKTLLTIHDCGFMNEERSRLAKEIYRHLWLKWPVERAAIVSANSQITKDDIVRYTGCAPEKVRVIPVAISTRYVPERKAFNKNKPRFLFVGSSANKNLERLIDALKEIECHLTIVGNLPDAHRAKLRDCEIEFENKHNLSDDDMVAAYRDCDALLFCSTFEGFGMPILEAHSIGRPVLTSTVASMPFVAGDAAFMVDPFDTQSIREGVLELIENDEKRERIVDAGFENVKRFDAQRIAESYYALYEELA